MEHLKEVVNGVRGVRAQKNIPNKEQVAEADIWHKNLIQKISTNRKRSFTLNGFQNIFESNGFRILECCTEDYEENIRDFYTRRTNEDLQYNVLLKSTTNSLNSKISKKMHIKLQDNNLFFTVQFCHLLLEQK